MPKAIRVDVFNNVREDIIGKLSYFCDKISVPEIKNYARSMIVMVKPKMEEITGIFGKELVVSQDFLNIMYKYGKITYDTAQVVHVLKFPEDILIKFKIEV